MPYRVPLFRSEQKRSNKKESDKFYSGARWVKLRKFFLSLHPRCEQCEVAGRLSLATVVHHLKERKMFASLAYDWTNLQALCISCHSKLHNMG